MVMGHSLGEYGALVAAGVLPFAEALEAAAARGREMTHGQPRRQRRDGGGDGARSTWSIEVLTDDRRLRRAPRTSTAAARCVIGGETRGGRGGRRRSSRRRATRRSASRSATPSTRRSWRPRAGRCARCSTASTSRPPQLPLVGNVTADFYPAEPDGDQGHPGRQIASPVQWVKGARDALRRGRAHLRRGRARSGRSRASSTTCSATGPTSCRSSRTARGRRSSRASTRRSAASTPPATARRETAPSRCPRRRSCGASRFGARRLRRPRPRPRVRHARRAARAPREDARVAADAAAVAPTGRTTATTSRRARSSSAAPASACPGADKPVMDPKNAARILRGEQFVDPVPQRLREGMARRARHAARQDGGRQRPLRDDRRPEGRDQARRRARARST